MKVICEKKDGYAILYLNNREKRNALDLEMSKQLLDKCKELADDDSVRAVVLTGKDGNFCAGWNIQEFIEGTYKSPVTHYEDLKVNADVFRFDYFLKKPVIAAVSGYALGGGFGLVAASHIVVADNNSKFGMPEMNLGIFPYCIYTSVKRAIGERLAVKLILTQEIFDVTYAFDIGLVHYIEENPLEKACLLAESISSKSSLVIKLAMDAIYSSRDNDLREDYLALLRIINFTSKDLKEGASAFLEKRKPQWKGE